MLLIDTGDALFAGSTQEFSEWAPASRLPLDNCTNVHYTRGHGQAQFA